MPPFKTPRVGTRLELLKPLARDMRRSPTPAEHVLWERVRDRQIEGVHFRRQHVIDRFIVRFLLFAGVAGDRS